MNASDKLTKLSGYHWAILLAPKDVPLSTSEDKDSIRWDVTNEDNPANNWRFRRAPVNQYLNVSLCARILPAKFDANDRKSTLVSVGDVLGSVGIIGRYLLGYSAGLAGNSCATQRHLSPFKCSLYSPVVRLKASNHCCGVPCGL